MVNNWAKRTPKNFKFTAKFPRAITHEKRLKHVDKELEQLIEAIGPLSDKMLALLIQLPPSLQRYFIIARDGRLPPFIFFSTTSPKLNSAVRCSNEGLATTGTKP
jgi:hypothetical protein